MRQSSVAINPGTPKRDAAGNLYVPFGDLSTKLATNRSGSWQSTTLPIVGGWRMDLAPDGTAHFVELRNGANWYRVVAPDGQVTSTDLTADLNGLLVDGVALLPDGRLAILVRDNATPLRIRATDGTITPMDLGLGGAETVYYLSAVHATPAGQLDVFYLGQVGSPYKMRRAYLDVVP